ncbi:MAG: putative ABC transporter permease [Oscillospiraceae bacterium]|nr:putative ABC transporter permease [Oscillospiraceae bacterium]
MKAINKRGISEYVLFFWVYAVIGWIYEVVLETFIYRWGFTNRGVLFGPWLPVYGFGAITFLFLWYRLIKEKPWKCKLLLLPVIFLLTMATATLIELVTSYLLEWTTGAWPWQTYADYAINFQARIALSPSLRFGLGGVVFLYVIQPLLDLLSSKMKDKAVFITAITIVSVMVVDLICTIIFRHLLK